jgi:hypothetical protein
MSLRCAYNTLPVYGLAFLVSLCKSMNSPSERSSRGHNECWLHTQQRRRFAMVDWGCSDYVNEHEINESIHVEGGYGVASSGVSSHGGLCFSARRGYWCA